MNSSLVRICNPHAAGATPPVDGTWIVAKSV
jgi:hypothetical protein